jgi:beta-1,2-N-acetylglucosaminyltransferase
MWMRMNEQRRDRECIIPDISRTYHFGASGLNVNHYFQSLYFQKHQLNDRRVPLALDHMEQLGYDRHLESLLQNAIAVRRDPCQVDEAILPDQKTHQAIFIEMKSSHDYETWLSLAKCWKLWDLDARGFHKRCTLMGGRGAEALALNRRPAFVFHARACGSASTWRLWLRRSPIVVVGSHSPWFRFKPVSGRTACNDLSRPCAAPCPRMTLDTLLRRQADLPPVYKPKPTTTTKSNGK